MKEEIREKVKTVKAQLFDLQLLSGQIQGSINAKVKELNDLQQELKICLPSETSSNS